MTTPAIIATVSADGLEDIAAQVIRRSDGAHVVSFWATDVEFGLIGPPHIHPTEERAMTDAFDQIAKAADVMAPRVETYNLVNTWNGGELGRKVVFTGTHNECFEWVLKHTPFSFQEATTRQGYAVEPTAAEVPA